jgi:6-phosphofructokinase
VDIPIDKLIDSVKAIMEKMNILALVSIGVEGSLSIGRQLFEGGVPLVGVPKTSTSFIITGLLQS